MTGPAVLLVVPRDLGAELEPLLGREGVAELRSALVSRAEAWGQGVAGARVRVRSHRDNLEDALTSAFATQDGPLLVVWPWLAQLRHEHAAGALEDLDEGCELVLGPVIDGGLYLLGLARPIPEVVSLPEERLQDPDVMTIAFAAAQEAGLEVGLLRAERALRRPSDVRAALADPLLPPEVRVILEGS